MKTTGRWLLGGLLAVLLLSLAGCGNAEKKATARLEEAQVLLRQGDLERAEAVLREVIASYPETEAAAQAGRKLEMIAARHRESRVREAAATLDRLAEVITGYRAMYNAEARRPADFDSSDYFFDTDYMAGIVPADTRVYLALGTPGISYRLWSLKEGAERGFLLEAGREVREVPRDEILETVRHDFAEELVKGNLVFVAPKRS